MTAYVMVEKFIKLFPEHYEKMNEVRHGYENSGYNPFHMEGSIWAHSMMVLNQAMTRYPDSEVMHLSALLHDLGKPYCFEDKDETKRRRFFNHEGLSTFYAKEVLDAFEVTDETKLAVLKIVANHGALYNFFDKETGHIAPKFIKKIAGRYTHAEFANMADFYWCDHLGRISEPSNLNVAELNKDFQNVLDTISLLNLVKSEKKAQTDKSGKVITVLVGPPRAGKSTWTAKNGNGATVISRDDVMEDYAVRVNGMDKSSYSERWVSLSKDDHKQIDLDVRAMYVDALKEGKDIVIDMTNSSKKTRRKWLTDNKLATYEKRAVVFITPLSVLLSRLTPEKSIPVFVLNQMMKSFSMPDLEEVDSVEIFLENNKG